METKTRSLRTLLLLAFGLRGMTALMYEVVWTRPLQLIFGSTIYAVSAMLTTLLFGFALGAYIFRNLADRAERPAMIFAALELGIGLYGFIILSLFEILPSIYLGLLEVPGFQFVQFILSFGVLIIPATLFGGTWPMVNAAYSSLEKLGKDTGMLYSWNSAGAACGSIAAGFILIPVFGIAKTSIIAAFLNVLIALLVFVFIRRRNENR